MREPQPPTLRLEKILAVCLALVAGYVDAYSVRAFSTYVSFMSGNTTQTGLLIGEHKFAALLLSALAIILFVTGSIAGTWLMHSGLRDSRRFAFGVIAVLLGIIAGANRSELFPAGLFVATLSLTMGIVNTILTRVGPEPVSLTFVTGTLNRIGSHLALAAMKEPLRDAQGPFDSHLRRAGVAASIWGGFLAGAVLSGMIVSRLGGLALLPPFLLILLLAFLSRQASTLTQAKTAIVGQKV